MFIKKLIYGTEDPDKNRADPIEKKKAIGEIILWSILEIIVVVGINLLLKNAGESCIKYSYLIEASSFILMLLIVFGVPLLFKDKELNFGFSRSKIWLQIVYGILIFAGMLFVYKAFGNSSDGQPLKFNKVMLKFLYIAFSAAITEELAYRGLLLTRLKKASGNVIVPVVVSSVFFGLSHFMVYDEPDLLVYMSVVGFVYGASRAYLKNCTLLSTMIAHFLYDFLICYIAI